MLFYFQKKKKKKDGINLHYWKSNRIIRITVNDTDHKCKQILTPLFKGPFQLISVSIPVPYFFVVDDVCFLDLDNSNFEIVWIRSKQLVAVS